MSQFQQLMTLFLLSIVGTSSAVKCITCATPYLKDNWYMTGLPQRPSKFHADCNVKDSLTGDKANLANLESVDCPSDSFCFSLVFQVPDVTDTTNGVSNVVQAVRGCHKTLAQVDNTPMPTNRKSKCDYSLTERKISSSGDLVAKLNTRMDFCNAADNCNFNYIATNDNCNEDSPVTKTCKQCSTTDSNCNDKTCTGRWCFKSETYVDDSSKRREILKECTSVNVFLKPTCVRTVSDAIVQTRSIGVPVDSTRCYCEGDNCNGAGLNGAAALLVVLSAAIAKLFV